MTPTEKILLAVLALVAFSVALGGAATTYQSYLNTGLIEKCMDTRGRVQLDPHGNFLTCEPPPPLEAR